MAKWIDKLQQRWNLGSTWQVIIILVVFACTGTTVLLIKKPLFDYWFPDGEKPLWANITYYILILPVYNILLLAYGFVFGQFKFFWDFEKRFFNRIITKFKNTKN
ncbi:MAG TPA: DUF6787 family protein [Cyclobacteriaceae bacterium]